MHELADPAWPARLQQACTGDLITPVYQPVVDLARGVVCGYEALSRFTISDRDESPADWFQAAAWHGCSGRLEAAALAVALAGRAGLPENCFLSVNVSPGGLLTAEVTDVLSAQGDLGGLVIEITEQTPVEDYDELIRVTDVLKARGALIAVDDTGAGYASLSHLLRLRPHIVKLDRVLVQDLDREQHRAAAVAAIGALADELDAWVVAEGVERSSELDRLIDLHVPLAQGFLLGRPNVRMAPLTQATAERITNRQRDTGRLASLAQRAPVMLQTPEVVSEITVVLDEQGCPRLVVVPAGGRRSDRHPPMCVQPEDDVRDVALRAVARRSEDRFGPVCLCDELGGLIGVIRIDSLLETLARESKSGLR